MIFQPETDLLRPRAFPRPLKLSPSIIQPQGSIWGLSFDGSSRIDIAQNGSLSPGTGNFSAIALIKTTNDFSGGNGWIFGDSGAGQISITAIGISTGNVARFICRDEASNSIVFNATGTINDGLAHQIVFVRNGTTVFGYVDGALNNQGTNASLDDIDTSNGITPVIGTSYANHTSAYFTGTIMQVQAYLRAITADEIKHNWENMRGKPDPTALAGDWQLQEGFGISDGSPIRDWSGNNNDGTMDGFTTDPWENIGVI